MVRPDETCTLWVVVVSSFHLSNKYDCGVVVGSGPLRLPLLLHGWDIVDVFGWDDQKLDMDQDFRRSYEPVFVLRNPRQVQDILDGSSTEL